MATDISVGNLHWTGGPMFSKYIVGLGKFVSTRTGSPATFWYEICLLSEAEFILFDASS